jgi:hypothetical protein
VQYVHGVDPHRAPHREIARHDQSGEQHSERAGEWVVGVKWLGSCQRKKPKRFAGMHEPGATVEELADAETEKFLASAFGT